MTINNRDISILIQLRALLYEYPRDENIYSTRTVRDISDEKFKVKVLSVLYNDSHEWNYCMLL